MEDNITMDPREIIWELLNRTDLSNDKDKWRIFVKTARNFVFHSMQQKF
jgi:hypothetical protein